MGPLFIAVCGLLIAVASLVAEHGSWAHRLQYLWHVGFAHGLSYSAACGILSDQGLNPCLLHWQADSLSLSHQGSPTILKKIKPISIQTRFLKDLSLVATVLQV